MKIEYEKAKLPDYEEIHTVMQTSAREISRKAYHKELVDTFDKFYIDKTKDYIKQTLENPDNHTIVAKDKNRITGFIQLKVNKQNATISHLYILPDISPDVFSPAGWRTRNFTNPRNYCMIIGDWL